MPEHHSEQASRQVTLSQQQPVIPCMLHQPPTRVFSNRCCKLVSDRASILFGSTRRRHKLETYIPEVLDSPDVVLVYSGVRFVGALKTPTQTDVYSWDGNQYKLEKSWIWDERMRYEDRFCVVDAISLSCPATPKKR